MSLTFLNCNIVESKKREKKNKQILLLLLLPVRSSGILFPFFLAPTGALEDGMCVVCVCVSV